MSEDYYQHVKQEYLEPLYENPGDAALGSELYTEIKKSTNVSEREALQVRRLLEKGEVGKADEQIEELLIQ